MLSKKEKILEAALELFAHDGFNATSTKKIAQKAGVSEGLIFKHFDNKKKLLEAIMEQAEERIQLLIAPILLEKFPKKIIERFILMPFHIDQSEYDFWRLQFKLKWEKEYYKPLSIKPLLDRLAQAFDDLNYPTPALEAQLLFQTIDAIAVAILREGLEQQLPLKNLLLNKYDSKN